MKSTKSRIGRKLVPIILCVALILTALMSIHSIDNLQGNARVINYIGIVRGATQRLIKKELNYEPDDNLIKYLDSILLGLSNGSDELNLIKLESKEFQALLIEMKSDWIDIKEEIHSYRERDSESSLYEMSEDYFDLADQAVLSAEVYTEKIVQESRNLLFYINFVFILFAGGCTVLVYYQEKRRKKLIEAENKNKQKSEELSKLFQGLLVPMNEISELIYVSDINTNELLFINDTGKKTFHISDTDHNLKCYKVLQGFDSPCSFCTTHCLKIDETYSWEYTNPITKKHYLLKDRLIEWKGRPARMEIAFDITEAANEKIELRKRLKRDNIIVECIQELYSNHDIILASTNVMRQVGELFSAERSYIFLLHDDTFTNIAEWCKAGITPQIDNLQNLSQSEYSGWFDMLDNHKGIIVDDLEKLKDTMPTEYEILSMQEIHNVIIIPLENDGQLNGFIGLDNLDFNLSQSAVLFLQTLQYFITLSIQRNENEKILYKLSYMDKLTSFYNRNRYIQDISELENKQESVGVIYLDLNGLKEINDCYGHDAGDKMLKNCTTIIQNSLNKGNFYRIGGDEFVIICTDISEEAFNDNVQRLKNDYMNNECKVAIGFKWEDNCKNIQNIIKKADELMYADKRKFYQHCQSIKRYRSNNELLQFLANPDILKEKINNNNFVVYLQSKINVENGKIVGAEALARYKDDNGSIQSPDKFIPVLENSFFISKVDYFIFEEICKNLSKWNDQGKTLFPISSNFSRITFMDENFIEKLKSISNRYKISRNLLEVELTESTSSHDYDILKIRIDQIRKAGFRVSIDDFGVESSNLSLLSMAEFDVLKIDKGFVKNIMQNENARMIVEMMAEICKKMNIQLVAEGVETNEQLDILKSCGVEIVQGFLFSRPKSILEY